MGGVLDVAITELRDASGLALGDLVAFNIRLYEQRRS